MADFSDDGVAFYGATFEKSDDARKEFLGKAAHWFNKALEFEKLGDAVKVNMAMKAASKAEADAFASS